MAVQINVQASQAALVSSIQAGVNAYNQKFANQNQINLKINANGFSQPLGRITGNVKDFEAALAASNARVIAFGASTAVLGGVIRGFKELANVTIEIEKSLTDINRVFGLSTAQLQKFSSSLFDVSKQTSSSFNDAAQAALEFSRQGLKVEEVLKRTNDALLLSKIAGMSTAASIETLTASVNGFKESGITTTQLLNKLVAVEQNYAVSAGDLANALSRTGQAAQEAGVGIDELNALVTAAQEKTARGGAVIGNALKTIFTRLQRSDTLDQLEQFNIAVRDIQGNMLPAMTILQNFAGVYRSLADSQKAQLSEQVAGVNQINILKAIIGDLSDKQSVYSRAVVDGANATNEASVAAAKLNQTLDALLSQTATVGQQFANNVGKVTFAPLAKETLGVFKSMFEGLNEVLEGEGLGSTFANGFLKGIRNLIAGPGAIAAFYTLFQLIKNSFTYVAQALPQIAGITTETQNRKNIESAILQIMQEQGVLSRALAGNMGNEAAQAQLLLNAARARTAQMQQELALAQSLAKTLAGQGVIVKSTGGLTATRSGGYIPASAQVAEIAGAQAGGYQPGRVVRSPVGGVMNTAETIKYVPGFAQPFINPPASSKAGMMHRQNSIATTGVDPYANMGFVPNFAENTKGIDFGARGKEFESKINLYLTGKAGTAGSNLLDFPFGVNAITSATKENRQKIFINDKTFYGDAKVTSANYSRKDLIKKLVGVLPPDKYSRMIAVANNPNTKKVYLNSFLPKGILPSLLSSSPIPAEDKEEAFIQSTFSEVINSLVRLSKGNVITDRLKKENYTKPILLKYIEDYVTIPNFSNKSFIPNFAGNFRRPPGWPFWTEDKRAEWLRLETERRASAKTKPISDASQSQIQKEIAKNRSLTQNEIDIINKQNLARGYDHIDIPYMQNGERINFALLKDRNPQMSEKQLTGLLGSTYEEFVAKVLKSTGYPGYRTALEWGLLNANIGQSRVDGMSIDASKVDLFEIKSGDRKWKQYEIIDKFKNALVGAPDAVLNQIRGKQIYNHLVRNRHPKDAKSFDGFIPNFAYKQSVMNLEQNLSGNKAIFDTQPFPHIRNASQPSFASAIADHGGLNNALSDSMRNQKAAGLMNEGFVPNFAKFRYVGKDGRAKRVDGTIEADNQGDAIEKLKKRGLFLDKVEEIPEIRLSGGAKPVGSKKSGSSTTNPAELFNLENNDKIDKATSDFLDGIKASEKEMGFFKAIFGGRKKAIADNMRKYEETLKQLGVTGQDYKDAMAKAGKAAKDMPTKMQEVTSKIGTTLAIVGPMIAGQLEQALYGNRKRTEMTRQERSGQSLVSTGVTAITTGASLGSAFGPYGVAVGVVVGGLVALAASANAANLSLEEIAQLNEERINKQKESSQAASQYIENQKKLTELISSGADQTAIQSATTALAMSFTEIKDTKLAEIFAKTGGSAELMSKELEQYNQKLSQQTSIAEALKNLQEGASNAFTALFSKTTQEKGVKDSENVARLLYRGFAGSGKENTLIDLLTKQKATSGTFEGVAQQENLMDITSFAFPNLKQGSEEFRAEYSRFVDLFFGSSREEIAKFILEFKQRGFAEQAISKTRKAATESFNEIFKRIEFNLKLSALQAAAAIEDQSNKNKIKSSILEFISSLGDSIDNFLISNLPEGPQKFNATIASATKKYNTIIERNQIASDEFKISQQKELNDYQEKKAQDMAELFKKSAQGSELAGKYFEQIFEQKKGDFTGLSSKTLQDDYLEYARKNIKKLSEDLQGYELSTFDTATLQKQLEEQNKKLKEAKPGEDTTKITTYSNELSDYLRLQELFNASKRTELDRSLQLAQKEDENFKRRQANALNEHKIKMAFSDAEAKANQQISIEKAKVDNQIMQRLEFIKDISAKITNTLEISKARSSQAVSRIQGRLSDQREFYGLGAFNEVQKRIQLEKDVLAEQRSIEDVTINAEIQQRLLEMEAEKANTEATLKLNDTITTLIDTELRKQLGPETMQKMISEQRTNPFFGKSEQDLSAETEKINKEAQNRFNAAITEYEEAILPFVDRFNQEFEIISRPKPPTKTYTPEEEEKLKLIERATFTPVQSSQFNAIQRIEQSRNIQSALSGSEINDFIKKLNDEGFNKIENGKLKMTFEDQIKVLEKIEKEGTPLQSKIATRYKEEIQTKKQVLAITRESVDEENRRKNIVLETNASVIGRFKKGYGEIAKKSDEMLYQFSEEIPSRFADGMTNALMEVAKGTKSIGDAFKDMAINFGQEIMQAVMRAAIGRVVGSAFTNMFGQTGGSVGNGVIGRQKGGIIYAQNGMYISGGRTGDKNPAMLEDGEYVLNRNAVRAFGGPKVLDTFNFNSAPRFGRGFQEGGGFSLYPELKTTDDPINQLYNDKAVGLMDASNYSAYAYANDEYFTKQREKAIQDEQERVQKAFARKQKNAQLISSIVGAVGSISLSLGVEKMAAQAALNAAKNAAGSALQIPANLQAGYDAAVKSGGGAVADFMAKNADAIKLNGDTLSYLQAGLNPMAKNLGEFSKFNRAAELRNIFNQAGFVGQVGKAGFFRNIINPAYSATTANLAGRHQLGGYIGFNSGGFVPHGSRLSDTIPALLTGGEYVMNNSAVRKYGLGTMNMMNAGGLQTSNSSSTSSSNTNNTNNNSTNISINVDRNGRAVYGANTTSYETNDIVFSKRMARQINNIVVKSMQEEKRYNGILYKDPLRT